MGPCCLSRLFGRSDSEVLLSIETVFGRTDSGGQNDLNGVRSNSSLLSLASISWAGQVSFCQFEQIDGPRIRLQEWLLQEKASPGRFAKMNGLVSELKSASSTGNRKSIRLISGRLGYQPKLMRGEYRLEGTVAS
jgi:hypothetical protein